MKKILLYGDSNTWGFIPGGYDFVKSTAKRYSKEQRWGGVVANVLGNSYEIIEEGLSGRTTILDDPLQPIMTSGKAYLLPCLLSHQPLDMVVIMLGTNDLKTRFNFNAFSVAKGIRQLIWLIRSLGVGTVKRDPEIVIICPPLVIEGVGDFQDQFIGAADKSQELAKQYSYICHIENCHFLDAGLVVKSSMIDGLHLETDAQQALGNSVADKIKAIFVAAS